MYLATIPEAYFVLCRMRIGIDSRRIHRQKQNVSGVSAMKQHVPVGMPYRM